MDKRPVEYVQMQIAFVCKGEIVVMTDEWNMEEKQQRKVRESKKEN